MANVEGPDWDRLEEARTVLHEAAEDRAEIARLRAGIQTILDATKHLRRFNSLGMSLADFCTQLLAGSEPAQQGRQEN